MFGLLACGLGLGSQLGWQKLSAAEPEAAPAALTLKDGLASNSPWLKGGKVDFLYRYLEDQHQYNFFGWSPGVKAGFGVHDAIDAGTTNYGGGYVRPLLAWPEYGDLILGGHVVSVDSITDGEYQGEYRLPFGLGVGGGAVERETGRDVNFQKLTFREESLGWNYILELQRQEVEREVSPGGYMALYNQQFMGVYGNDGEQWRATGGYVAPENRTPFRPAAELLYVDNSIGDAPGPRVFFGNATLKLQGGFLAHPARLGRAMGPQGLEYGNPLGFLAPTWNRRLDPWEMGGLADFRLEIIRYPNHTRSEDYELVVFPFQFDRSGNLLDYLFAGGSFGKSPSRETGGVIAGLTGAIGCLRGSVGVKHEFEPARTMVTVGLIDFF